MSKSKAFQQGSDYGFKRLLMHTPEAECPYPVGSDERIDWFDGYFHGRQCEVTT